MFLGCTGGVAQVLPDRVSEGYNVMVRRRSLPSDFQVDMFYSTFNPEISGYDLSKLIKDT